MSVQNMKPSLNLIAAECGVSTMTVSRALRNDPNVAELTRRRVLKVAQELSYFPPSSRKVNGSREHSQYYIVFKKEWSASDAFFSDIILSIQQELFIQGFGCAFGVADDNYSEFLKLYDMMNASRAGGVIVTGDLPVDYLNVLLDRFENLVLVDHPGDRRISRPYNAVYCDTVLGAHQATSHLIKLGRSRTLLVTGRPDHYWSNDMLAGYKLALADNGIPFDASLVIPSTFHTHGGREAIDYALDQNIAFDAVLSNDEMACGAINALKSMGRRIPQDISVVGSDGLPMGEEMRPALTTTAVDREKMARLAVQLITGEDSKTQIDENFCRIAIFPKLIVRESCGGRQVGGSK
jgi:DNA-binding LacI/PurR family transcriptional regulator